MALQREGIHDENPIAIVGHVSDAGAAITDFDTDLTEGTNDHYNGMLMMFLGSSACAGQAHLIDDYTAANGNCAFVAGDQWTDVPANNVQSLEKRKSDNDDNDDNDGNNNNDENDW